MEYKDQEYREYYYGELKRTLTAAAIAFLVFVSIFANLMGGDVGAVVVSALSGLAFSGLPCGWEITGKVFGGWYMTGVGGILVLFLRATLSGAIGVFALPIKLISLIKKCCGNAFNSQAAQKNKKRMIHKVVKALVLYVVALLAICIAAFLAYGSTNSRYPEWGYFYLKTH